MYFPSSSRLCFALIFLLLWSTTLCAASPPTILVLGDSLSAAYGIEEQQGWVALLQKKLQTEHYPHQVVNISISGDTTEGGLNRLPQALSQFQPDILILALGANDGLRGTPLQRTRDNLTEMIHLAKQQNITVLLVGMALPPNYGPRYNQQFSKNYSEIAQQQQVAFVPFLLEKMALQRELFQEDGLHPIAEAQPLLLETVWFNLKPLLGDANKQSSEKFNRPFSSEK